MGVTEYVTHQCGAHEYDVYAHAQNGGQTWVATFARYEDAELFVKIKQINEILSQ